MWAINAQCVTHVGTVFFGKIPWRTSPWIFHLWSVIQGLFIWARSTGLTRFPRSRLVTLFIVKISMCSYERPGWPGYRGLGFCDRYLGNRDENFPIWYSSPVTGTKRFIQNGVALTTYRPKWRNFGLVCVSSLGVCELALLVTLLRTAQSCDSREQYKFMFHHFGCVSWIHFGRPGWNFPYEHTTDFVLVTEPARLPGSYEEALSVYCLKFSFEIIKFV